MRREVLDEVRSQRVGDVMDSRELVLDECQVRGREAAIPQLARLQKVALADVDDFEDERDDDTFDVSWLAVVRHEQRQRTNLAHGRAHRIWEILQSGGVQFSENRLGQIEVLQAFVGLAQELEADRFAVGELIVGCFAVVAAVDADALLDVGFEGLKAVDEKGLEIVDRRMSKLSENRFEIETNGIPSGCFGQRAVVVSETFESKRRTNGRRRR